MDKVMEARLNNEKPCDHCETDGVWGTDGAGPFDCYACGKKANISGWVNGFPPAGELCEARIPHHTSEGMQMLWCEVEVIAHAVIKGVIYSWVKDPGPDGSYYAPLMLSFRRIETSIKGGHQ